MKIFDDFSYGTEESITLVALIAGILILLDATARFWPPIQKNQELSSRLGSVICFIQLTAVRVGIA